MDEREWEGEWMRGSGEGEWMRGSGRESGERVGMEGGSG